MDEDNQINLDDTAQLALQQAYQVLLDSKPKERGELARRYQISITDLERVMGYFETFVMQRSHWPNVSLQSTELPAEENP